MSELLSVSEAAKVIDIPERTFRRWVASGRVPSEPDPLGARGRVVNADVVVRFRDMMHGNGQVPASGPPMAETNRPAPANAYLVSTDWERERELLLDDRRRQDEEIGHLRAQLDVRSQEIAHRDQAEAELRRLLLASQNALAALIERPMLPPAHGDREAPAPKPRVRWWSLWRR